jgi:predicted nucleotidyltransferase
MLRNITNLITRKNMSAKELDLATQRATQAFLARLHARDDLAAAFLFGSRARGDAHADSDADIAVLLHGHTGCRVEEALRLADLAFEVMLETGVLIEAIPFWEDEWAHAEQFSNPSLLESIQCEGIRL